MEIKATDIELVDIDSLILNPKNNNHHPPEQIERLAKLVKSEKEEKWKITECGRYAISSHGRLFSFIRSRLKKSTKTKDGYLTHSIGRKTTKAHRLVAKYFIENFDENLQVNHIDFDRKNNNVSNLQMTTLCENIRHSARAGKYTKNGESNNNCKVDEVKVLTIKTCAGFFTDKFIAEKLGLKRKYVNDVKLGKIRGN